jgi:acylglycerol lipase
MGAVSAAWLLNTWRRRRVLPPRARRLRFAVQSGAGLLFAVAGLGLIARAGDGPDLPQRPPVAPPPGATFFRAPDGTRLFADVDAPPVPRAVVVIVQGVQASSGPDFPLVRAALREAGIGSATVHSRGTGFSDGPRGDAADFDLLVEDQAAFARDLQARFPRAPLVLLGHSAGGAIALELAARLGAGGPAGIVLVNPAVRTRAGGPGPSVKDVASYAFHLAVAPAQPVADMTGDPARLHDEKDRRDAQRLRADPLTARRLSLRLLTGMQAVMQRAPTSARALTAPLIIFVGLRDEIIDPSSAEEIAGAWKGTNKEVRTIDAPHGTTAVEGAAADITAFVERVTGDRTADPLPGSQ